MNCRHDACERAALRDSTLCEAHLRSVLAAAFGGTPEPVRHVERLSESDPMVMAIQEELRERRPRHAA